MENMPQPPQPPQPPFETPHVTALRTLVSAALLAIILGAVKRDMDTNLLPEFFADQFASLDTYDLRGTVAVVTGANRGVGFGVARALTAVGGTVILGCRSRAKCTAAAAVINAESAAHGGRAVPMVLDLARLSSVDAFAATFARAYPRLDYLVCNAGFSTVPTHDGVVGPLLVAGTGIRADAGTLSAEGSTDALEHVAAAREEAEPLEGYEVGLGVMHFAHFRLFARLRKQLLRTSNGGTADVRVVATSAYWGQKASVLHGAAFGPWLFEEGAMAGEGDFKGEVVRGGDFVKDQAMYARAKLANQLFARELQKRMPEVTACSCHVGGVAYTPMGGGGTGGTQVVVAGEGKGERQEGGQQGQKGVIDTLVDAYSRAVTRRVDEGRRTLLKCLLSQDADVVKRGAYIDGMGLVVTEQSRGHPIGLAKPSKNDTLAKRLWDVTHHLVGRVD
jgi:NAD(P)-dependent dehydrogenase (short-subunit alcohol dehydrogenase family)